MLIVVSEPGEQRYEAEFRKQGEVWKQTAEKGNFAATVVGMDPAGEGGDRAALEKALSALPKDGGDLWLVWIGHGSYDGRTANFNLRGRDVSSAELRELLAPFTRRLVILNLFSASSPFLKELSGDNRVIIGSTRSDGERNYTRFGGAMAEALTAADADLDRDGAVSLIEATLTASSKVRAFYEDAQRVMQEHAVIDDNGDGMGTPAETFKGLRAGRKPADGKPADGLVAREIHFLKPTVDPLDPAAREKRAALEAEIEALREKKKTMQEDDYYRQLEVLMRKMAELYQ
ncbi:MAG: hypothetical protein KF712_00945 [Akkermansiaceae bacterium]|nr:hypothetical protein [Akkermansiaceae bacterium]